MNLICIVGVPVCEDKRQREVVAMVNNRSAGVGGGTDVGLRDSVDAFERFETGAEGVVIVLIFGVVKPEENGVYKHSFFVMLTKEASSVAVVFSICRRQMLPSGPVFRLA